MRARSTTSAVATVRPQTHALCSQIIALRAHAVYTRCTLSAIGPHWMSGRSSEIANGARLTHKSKSEKAVRFSRSRQPQPHGGTTGLFASSAYLVHNRATPPE